MTYSKHAIRAARIIARRLLREEAGNQIVELALASIIFFTAILGAVDVCRAMYAYHFASYAAQQGARYAIVRGGSFSSSCSTTAPPNFNISFKCVASSSDVQNYVKSLPGVKAANMTATTTWPGTTPSCSSSCSACTKTNSQGCMVNVAVSYKFQFIVPFLPKSAVYFTASSKKAIQQ